MGEFAFGVVVLVFLGWLLVSPLVVVALVRRLRVLTQLSHRLADLEDRQRTLERLFSDPAGRRSVAPVAATPRVDDEPDRAAEPTPPSRQITEPPREPIVVPPAPEPIPPSPRGGWEETIGGNWLNKIGAILVVVGIGLFVGYSLAHLGPAGRLAIGFAAGGFLLAAGMAAERLPGFRIFGIGLIAGGWAGIYVTTFAMHGLAAARVIDEPAVALGLLVAVAAGMILHSLRFRLPAVTAVAYLGGYAAIAISPPSAWSPPACILLAASLLVVAYRFRWALLAVVGIVSTYATLALHDAVVPAGAMGQVMIVAAWVVFEVFDVARSVRDAEQTAGSRPLLPLNACGLLGVSLLTWPREIPLFWLFAAAAALYAASSVVRGVLGPKAAAAPAAANLVDEIMSGGGRATATIAAALAGAAIWQRFEREGLRLVGGLLLEAEFLFLLGITLEQRFFRGLSAPVFAVAVGRLLLVEVPAGGELTVAGVPLLRWTPPALGIATLMALDRLLAWRVDRRGGQPPTATWPAALSVVAAMLAAMVAAGECTMGRTGLGQQHLGISWIVLAGLLVWLGVRSGLPELIWEGGVAGLAGTLVMVAINGLALTPTPAEPWQTWIWLAPAACVLGLGAWRLPRVAGAPGVASEAAVIGAAALPAAVGLTLLVLWHALPAPLVAPGWAVVAVLLVDAGASAGRADLRWYGSLSGGLMLGRLLLANFTTLGLTAGISHRLLTVIPVIAATYYLADRLLAGAPPGGPSVSRSTGRLFRHAGAVVILLLLRFELGRVLALPAWCLLGLLLLIVGLRRGCVDLRLESYLIAALAFARAWGTGFAATDAFGAVPGPVALGGFVVGCLFAAFALAPRPTAAPAPDEPIPPILARLDRHARGYFGILGTVLLAVLIFHETPAQALTVAWGLEGAAVLAAGFACRDQVLRFAGLAMLGVCVPKLFLYDTRHLETSARIVSFVLLGLLLLTASWVYARARAQLPRAH